MREKARTDCNQASQFFEGKAIEHLLGKGIEAKHLNDDRLGRALDDYDRYGVTTLFTTVALSAAKKFGVETQRVHLDSSSLAVEGQYLAEAQTSEREGTTEKPVPIQDPRLEPIRIPLVPLGAVRNQALKHVRMPWVAYCDGDDVWCQGKTLRDFPKIKSSKRVR